MAVRLSRTPRPSQAALPNRYRNAAKPLRTNRLRRHEDPRPRAAPQAARWAASEVLGHPGTVTAGSSLQQLARLLDGEPHLVLRRLLAFACEHLAVDTVVVTVVGADGRHTIRLAVLADGTDAELDPDTTADVVRRSALAAHGPLLVHDTRRGARGGSREDAFADAVAPADGAHPVGAYVGVPLLAGGTVTGTLGAVAARPHDSLQSRDVDLLTRLGEVVEQLLRQSDVREPDVPVPGDDLPAGSVPAALAAVAEAVDRADDLERLSRPLIDALLDLTGLSSAYLTAVDANADVQEILFAGNAREDFTVREGLVVPWKDTLCKRALDDDRPFTNDVPSVWGDSEAARKLGIRTFVSVPVTMPDGRVWGTLCAADPVAADDLAAHVPTMRLFARLIASQVERDAAVAQARAEADTDPLTGCSSRRVVKPWLTAQISALPLDEVIALAFIDLDGFKPINDTHGHAAGDAVLAEVGRRLRTAARPHDLVARLGGDEFLVAVRVPRGAEEWVVERVRDAANFSMPWQGAVLDVRCSTGVAVSDEHDADSLVAAADARMYAQKTTTR